MDKRISIGEHERHRRGTKFFTSEAKHRLFEKNHLIKLIFAFLTVCIFFGFFFYLFVILPEIAGIKLFGLSENSVNAVITAIRIIIFFTGSYTVFGLLCGYYLLCVDIYEKDDGELGRLFYAFESGHRMRSCLCGYVLTLLWLLPFAVLFTLSMLFEHESLWVHCLVTAFSSGVGIFFFLIFAFLSLAYPFGKGKSFGKRLKSAFSLMKNHIFSCFILTLRFIPLIIISVLSFGILFIIYTVPFITLSYAALGSYAVDREKYGITGG